MADVNVPVRLQSEDQESTIHPGDIIVGDLNGVVCIPSRLAEEVLRLMPSQVEADEKVAKAISEGREVGEAMKEYRAGVAQPGEGFR